MGLFDGAKEKLLDLTRGSGEEVLGEETDKGSGKKSQNRVFGSKKQKRSSVKKGNTEPAFVDEANFTVDDFLDKDLGEGNEAIEKGVAGVLEALQIDDALQVPNTVMMPEDFKRPKFSKATPIGYDMAEVDSFINQARASLQTFLDLHDARNKDIIKLAEYSTRLINDNKELLYNAELAQGVSVMPTESESELALSEAKMTIMALKSQLQKYERSGPISEDAESYYTDRIAILEREQEELKWENKELKAKIISLENSASEAFEFTASEMGQDDNGDYFQEDFFEENKRESLPQVDEFGADQPPEGLPDLEGETGSLPAFDELPGLDEF